MGLLSGAVKEFTAALQEENTSIQKLVTDSAEVFKEKFLEAGQQLVTQLGAEGSKLLSQGLDEIDSIKITVKCEINIERKTTGNGPVTGQQS
jgi:hypothetical protein